LLAACDFDGKTVRFLQDQGADISAVRGKDLHCDAVPASLSEWFCAASAALVLGSSLSWLLPWISKVTSGFVKGAGGVFEDSESRSLVVEKRDEESEGGDGDRPESERGLDGAKLLVSQAWLGKQKGCLKLQASFYSLGRLNSQLILIMLLAWLGSKSSFVVEVGGHDVTFSGVLFSAFVMNVIIAWLLRPSSAGKVMTAMDFVLPRSISLTGLQGVDGRWVVVMELIRLSVCLCVALPGPGDPLWTHGWPLRLPGTTAGTHLEMLDLAGLHLCFYVACAGVVLSAAVAILHSLASLFLVLGRSKAAKHLRGEDLVVCPEDVRLCARDLAEQRERQLGRDDDDDDSSSSSSSESDSDEIQVKLGEDELDIKLISQTWWGFGNIMFLLSNPLGLVTDILLDLTSARNFMIGGHIAFGTLSLTLFVYSMLKNWRWWCRFKEEVSKTIRYGFWTQGFYELAEAEVEDEAILSLMLNVYGLPWAIHGRVSLAVQCGGILMSVKTVVNRMLQRDLGL